MPPRAIGTIDHTGACAELATALCRAAADVGATARLIDVDSVPSDLDTLVIIAPQSPKLDDYAAAAEVARQSAAREAKEAANRARFQAGELGLDVYDMREALAAKGLVYRAYREG